MLQSSLTISILGRIKQRTQLACLLACTIEKQERMPILTEISGNSLPSILNFIGLSLCVLFKAILARYMYECHWILYSSLSVS